MADDGPDLEVGDPLYLPSPAEAVPILSDLLARGDWETLARYYDLSGVGEPDDPGAVVDRWPWPDASWFTDAPAPYVAIAPRPPFRYRHPFPPSFEYVGHEVEGDEARVVVEGSWTPDSVHGEEAAPQAGRWAFRMRRHDEGWQVLPDPVERLGEGTAATDESADEGECT